MKVTRTFNSIDHVPDMSGKRFSVISLGADRANELRAQFLALRAFAAKVVGVEPGELTDEMLHTYTNKETRHEP
jgi:hypothetical protein